MIENKNEPLTPYDLNLLITGCKARNKICRGCRNKAVCNKVREKAYNSDENEYPINWNIKTIVYILKVFKYKYNKIKISKSLGFFQ